MVFLTPSGSPSSRSVSAMALDFPPWALYNIIFDGPVGTSPAHSASSGVIAARSEQPVSAMAEGPRRNAEGAAFVGQNVDTVRLLRLHWTGCTLVPACSP